MIFWRLVKNMKPNLQSISEFRRADAEHKGKLGEYEEVNGKREDARRQLEDLRRKRHEEFMAGSLCENLREFNFVVLLLVIYKWGLNVGD